MRRIAISADTALRCTTCSPIDLHVLCCIAGDRAAGLMVVCHVGHLYTYLRR